MTLLSVVLVLLFAGQLNAQTTPCEDRGGECKKKDSHCCPEKMDFDPLLCGTDSVCCLPASGGRRPGSGDGGTRPPNPDKNCTCSAHQQNVLCEVKKVYALFNGFGTGTPGVYFPKSQVSSGCDTGACLIRGPSCPGPSNVCLKKQILNFLQCAPHACSEEDRWLLTHLLISKEAIPEKLDFCNGRAVSMAGCDVNKLRTMCSDIGGSAEEAGGGLTLCKLL